MTLDEHQTKPPILDGLAEYLAVASSCKRSNAAFGEADRLLRWAMEVAAIQSAITHVGEEE